MTTVADFVKDTLGLLQLVNPNQTVKAEDMATAIRFLNRFMERTEANTIATGWAPVANPTDEVPLPGEAELGVMYQLAMVLAPQYGVDPLAGVVAGARMFMDDLIRDQMVATPIRPIIMVPNPDQSMYHTGGLVAGGIVG